MTPGDRVAQLYPQALGTNFSHLLRHAWVTVGLFFNPGHNTGSRRRWEDNMKIDLREIVWIGLKLIIGLL
jgi:hypothetical protein